MSSFTCPYKNCNIFLRHNYKRLFKSYIKNRILVNYIQIPYICSQKVTCKKTFADFIQYNAHLKIHMPLNNENIQIYDSKKRENYKLFQDLFLIKSLFYIIKDLNRKTVSSLYAYTLNS
jgi:hypothetical protein